MSAKQPRLEADSFAMWSPALARGLIRDEAMRSMHYCDGYTDLLGSNDQTPHSLAQRAMRSPAVAAAYERVWRLMMVAAMRLRGVPMPAERERAAAALRLGGEERVLDVACGSGHFTGFMAGQLGGGGFVIGVDTSVPMVERAVRDNSCPRAVYMRADTLSLPFNDRAFDVVCCLAGLHHVAEPIAILHEMVRVLSPGGRIAVLTSYGRESILLRKGVELGATICGVRVFDRTTIPAFFAAAGLTDIDQQLRGISQFVSARRPEQLTELDHWRTRSAGRWPRRRPTG